MMKIIRKRELLGAAAFAMLAILAPGRALAHSAPEKAAALRGGVAAQTEHFNLELVAIEGRLKLYVRDRHNRATDARSYGGSALVWGANATALVDFTPGVEAGLLEAAGDFSVATIRRVIVTITAPGHAPEKAWFSGFGSDAR